jgi:hypothetical protein
MAASQTVVFRGPVRRTESIWRWNSGGMTLGVPGGGSPSPPRLGVVVDGAEPDPVGVVVAGPFLVPGGAVLGGDVGAGNRPRNFVVGVDVGVVVAVGAGVV